MHNHILQAQGPVEGCPACARIRPEAVSEAYARIFMEYPVEVLEELFGPVRRE